MHATRRRSASYSALSWRPPRLDCPRTSAYIFLNNSVKNQPTVIIFGTRNSEKMHDVITKLAIIRYNYYIFLIRNLTLILNF